MVANNKANLAIIRFLITATDSISKTCSEVISSMIADGLWVQRVRTRHF